MKISIEHKKPDSFSEMSAEHVSHNVTIDHPSDDLDATEMARLLFYAMTACSYHPNSVRSGFYDIAMENGFDPESSE